jgi:hypothetical protein
MQEIDSILYLITAIVEADEANHAEMEFVKRKVFERLEKVQTHVHERTAPEKIAVYLKFHVPEVAGEIAALYKEAWAAPKFQLPNQLKLSLRSHLENLKRHHMSERELREIIHEAMDADNQISPQEIILRDFLYKEIQRIYS